MAEQDDKEHHVHYKTKKIRITENDDIYEEYDSIGKGCVDVSLLDEIGIDFTDPIQVDILYIESRNSIINGTLPCTKSVAVLLAAYQCQVQYGDHNKSRHKRGFHNWSEFLPEDFLNVEKIRNDVGKYYKNLTGMTEIEIKCFYIKCCRSLKTFGGTFFHVKEKVHWHKDLVPYILGITPRAVLRMDKNTKEVLNEWPYTTVRHYAGNSDMLTLDFGESYYTAQTTEGVAICQLMSKYINTLMQNKRKRSHFDAIENEDASVTVDTTKETTLRSLSIDTLDKPICSQILDDQLACWSLEGMSEILYNQSVQEQFPQMQDNQHQQQEVAQLLTSEDQHYEMQQEETTKITQSYKDW